MSEITKKRVYEELETIMDPELGLDLVTLGLIYNVEIVSNTHVVIEMTFTTPMCPFGPAIKQAVSQAMYDIGLKAVEVRIVFDPPWKPPKNLREMLGV
jgi:metal-sulfur cluster biosynthetic enzyme